MGCGWLYGRFNQSWHIVPLYNTYYLYTAVVGDAGESFADDLGTIRWLPFFALLMTLPYELLGEQRVGLHVERCWSVYLRLCSCHINSRSTIK